MGAIERMRSWKKKGLVSEKGRRVRIGPGSMLQSADAEAVEVHNRSGN
jgi:hypothetical protein